MSVLSATVGQMLVLFTLILLGYIVAKAKAVPEDSATVLSKLENNLFVPALVLGTFVSNFTVEKLGTAWKLFLISFAICLVMMFLAVIVARCCSKDNYHGCEHGCEKSVVHEEYLCGVYYKTDCISFDLYWIVFFLAYGSEYCGLYHLFTGNATGT